MISPFAKQKERPLDLLTLPSYCVPSKESDDLAAKREAQLEWMRQKGLTYLGDPLKRLEKKPPRRPPGATMRLVRIGGGAPPAASESTGDFASDG